MKKRARKSWSLRQQFVRIGESRGDFVAITEGLKAGEMVASDGRFQIAQRHGRDDQ